MKTKTANIAHITPTAFDVKEATAGIGAAFRRFYGRYSVEAYRNGLIEATIYVRPASRSVSIGDVLTALGRVPEAPAYRNVHVRAFYAVSGVTPLELVRNRHVGGGDVHWRREGAGVLFLVPPKARLTKENAEFYAAALCPKWEAIAIEITK